MGKQNTEMYRYLEDETRFADLFNATQFAGEEIVEAGKLKEASEHYVKEELQGSESKIPQRQETFRDLKKRLEDGTELRILAVENQERVNYTMPWRLMDYDNSEYSKQVKQIQKRNKAETEQRSLGKMQEAEWLCKFRKSDKLAPVYTICLYHGKEKWDGPRSLRDMMEFGNNGELWKRMFVDYPMRLVCVNELTDFSCFKTSLGQLLEVLALQDDKNAMTKLLEEKPEYHHLDRDTMEAIAVMTNSEELLDNMDNYENEEGGYEMCKAFRELIEDGRQEGIVKTLTDLVKDGLLSVTEAASRAGIPEIEFIKLLG